jgi:hypothetical protein
MLRGLSEADVWPQVILNAIFTGAEGLANQR